MSPSYWAHFQEIEQLYQVWHSSRPWAERVEAYGKWRDLVYGC